MFTFETSVRVRYAETDQMGYVYYGNYSMYYEVARTDALRSLGLTYKELEAQGVMLPVLQLNCKYIRPGKYDDLLRIRVVMQEMPTKRIKFDYEVFREDDTLINIGSTTLVFVDMKTAKPTEAPDHVKELFMPFFEKAESPE
ncbi:MAG: acyl-CoA thioesterase [Cytophagales bacterium]|nr:acyl-CoA thioesterase [Cytophagales bacterium]